MPEREGYDTGYEIRGYESPYNYLFAENNPNISAAAENVLILADQVSVNVTRVLSVNHVLSLVQTVNDDATLNFALSHSLTLVQSNEFNQTINKNITHSLTLIHETASVNDVSPLRWDDNTDLYWDDNTLLYWI